MHARHGPCLAPAGGARCWGVQCRIDALRMARQLANPRASRWEVVLPPSRGQAHLSWFSSTCRKKLAKDIASQGQCLSGLPKGWRCHPRGLSARKILCPSLIRAKDVFPVSALKKTSTKREDTQMDTQFKDGVFQQERLDPKDNRRLRAGINNVLIHLPQRQRSQAPTSCNRRFLQSSPSHSR